MIKLINLLKEALTEVSVEQLQTQFVDSGKISQKDFNDITSITSKTAYITWLAKKVADKLVKAEDIYKFKKYFSVFDRRKKDYPFTDINQYKTYEDVIKFRGTSIKIADEESEDPSKQKGISKGDKYKEFYLGSVEGYDVYKLPQGRKDLYGVSCELGSGTEWCTATGKTREHFDDYISKGPLFIFIKPDINSKFQFNYETESYMDEEDTDILDLEWSEEGGKMIYNLFQFIGDKEPEYKNDIPTRFKNLYKFVYNSESLTPEDLHVKNLFLQDSNISSLPAGLKVDRALSLYNTNISSLPDNLKVGMYLDLHDTPISKLPLGLEIGSSFDISNTNISEIPKDLKVSGFMGVRNTPFFKKYEEKYGPDKKKIYDAIKNDHPNLKDVKFSM
jgi:hypothetical protein